MSLRMLFMKLVNDRMISIFLLVFAIIFVCGCDKSSPVGENELIRSRSIRFCANVMTHPTASDQSKFLAKDVLLKRDNGTIDPEPILVRAQLDQFKKETGPVLIVGVSDEDGDLVGIGVRELHTRPDNEPYVIEEEYPVFEHRSEKTTTNRLFPIMIRNGAERKNEEAWREYLDKGPQNEDPWKAEDIPALWISLPDAGKVEVEIWIYDRAGHKSAPVSVENWIPSTQNDGVGKRN